MSSRPWRSRVHPFPSPVCSRTTVTWPCGSQRRSRLPARSTKVTEPSACQSGPSVRPQPVVSTVGSVDRRIVDRFSGIVDLLGGNQPYELGSDIHVMLALYSCF